VIGQRRVASEEVAEDPLASGPDPRLDEEQLPQALRQDVEASLERDESHGTSGDHLREAGRRKLTEERTDGS
jgi:hypothetical protein